MLIKLIASVVLIALCSAQDYDEYEPQQPQQQAHRTASPRFISQPKEQQKAAEPVVAILKQINRHNEDGSYTYGYEASDGSFKIETKAANGEVKGKYGYVDETGKVRMVEYGANKFGFQPSGEGITVAPINFNDVKDDVEYEEEQPRQQYIARPKQVHKPVKSQAIKYAPVSYEQQREPTYAAHPQPQHVKAPSPPVRFIEYEEETTQRAIQYVQQQQSKAQRIPAPASPSRHQQQYDVGILYSQQQQQHHQQQDIRPFQAVTQKYQQYENRSPPVFPVEQTTATPRLAQNEETVQQRYSLFNPAAAPRYDVYTKTKQYETFSPEPNHYAPKPRLQQAPAPQAPAPQAPAPQHQYQYQQQQQPISPPRPAYAAQPTQLRTTSILDELVKDPNYKISQSSNPLHDISFGYNV